MRISNIKNNERGWEEMKKINMFAVVSLIATFFATVVATSACWWYLYQPEEPKCLRDL